MTATENRHWGRLNSGRDVFDSSPQWEREQFRREQQQHNGQDLDDPYRDVPPPDEPPADEPDERGESGSAASASCVQSLDGDPIPLTQTVEIPPFPVGALPEPIAEMVQAVAEATQTDPAMAGTSALSVLSACSGGHVEIEIRSGWRETMNLYTATGAAPGERKSAVQYAMVRPIHNVEAQLTAKGAGARLEAETRKLVAEQAAEQQRKAAARADDDKGRDEALADAIGAAMLADAIEVPPIPRLVADDITPEALGSLLAEQGGRLAIITAEGGIFDIIAGRYSRLPSMDLWLKAHCGDLAKVDRKGRPPEYVRRPVLTLGLMIQPSVLHTIAANREFRGRGLLARFLYARPVSKVGHRNTTPATVADDIRTNYEDTVRELAAGLAEWRGDPAILMLTPTARTAMEEIDAAVEPTLAPTGELGALADWGAKYVGTVARIAGMLHLAEHGAEAGPRQPVSAQTILAAWRVGEYFRACAINVFAEMGTDQDTADAAYLLERVESLGLDEVSERDLHVAARSRFPTKADLRPALDRLVDHGYLVPLPRPKSKGGRPPSPRYEVRR